MCVPDITVSVSGVVPRRAPSTWILAQCGLEPIRSVPGSGGAGGGADIDWASPRAGAGVRVTFAGLMDLVRPPEGEIALDGPAPAADPGPDAASEPDAKPAPEPDAEPGPEPKTEPEPEAGSASEPEPVAEPGAAPEPDAELDSEPGAAPEPEPEPGSASEPESEPEPEPDAAPEPAGDR